MQPRYFNLPYLFPTRNINNYTDYDLYLFNNFHKSRVIYVVISRKYVISLVTDFSPLSTKCLNPYLGINFWIIIIPNMCSIILSSVMNGGITSFMLTCVLKYILTSWNLFPLKLGTSFLSRTHCIYHIWHRFIIINTTIYIFYLYNIKHLWWLLLFTILNLILIFTLILHGWQLINCGRYHCYINPCNIYQIFILGYCCSYFWFTDILFLNFWYRQHLLL